MTFYNLIYSILLSHYQKLYHHLNDKPAPRKIETELHKCFSVCFDECGVAEFTHVHLDMIMLQVLIYLSSQGEVHREEFGGSLDESTITSAQPNPTRISG